MSLLQSSTLLVAIIAIYLLLVRILRYRRSRHISNKHGSKNRESLTAMSVEQAQDILQDLVELEFPTMMGFSIVFALFRTYGVPSISSLLVSTGELASQETASKRIADTGVLLLEFCLNKPSSTRAMEAIARMNYLHSRYIKAGKIWDDDMLYTLGLFALEPIRWIDRYEWRSMTDTEICASGNFWKSMGDKMDIDMSQLGQPHGGWRDGRQWLDAIRSWSEKYEEANMVPAEVNRRLVNANLEILFLNLPDWMKAFGGYIAAVACGSRLREAVLLDTPPAWFEALLMGVMTVRKYALRYLALPRAVRKSYISTVADSDGRYSMKEYLSHPWYVKPTFLQRWGLRALATRLLGRKLPGDDGNRYCPEGYKVVEVGPSTLREKGKDYMVDDVRRLQALRPASCPFAAISGK